MLPADYDRFLADIKERIRTAQLKTALAANAELIRLYWSIGRDIVDKQSHAGWGAKVVNRLATDLQREFPGIQGISRTNIYRMRAFFLGWNTSGAADGQDFVPQAVGQLEEPIVPQAVGQLPWGHNVLLIERLKSPAERLWYAEAAIQHGWSRSVLALQIESGLHKRQGKALTNFSAALPASQSDLAQQTLKDPYVFDFLTLGDDAREREVEQALLDHIQAFMLEMGVGFAFVGRQVNLEVSGQDYYIDLLFYHLKLRCYVVVDLKVGEFKPDYAGKMNFYLSAVDDLLRHPDDRPTIGLLLCKAKDKLTVEYALRDLRKPIGVAEWRTRLVESLPKRLQGKLPTIEQIEEEFDKTTRTGT